MVKNPPANAGEVRDAGLIPSLGRFPGRRAWKPTPVFLPREPHGWRSLMGPRGCKELDMTERLHCTSLHSAYKLNKQGDNIQS